MKLRLNSIKPKIKNDLEIFQAFQKNIIIFLLLIFMGVNHCYSQRAINAVLQSNSDTVKIVEADYKLLSDDKYSIRIEVIDSLKVQLLKNKSGPVIVFSLRKQELIAKGNYIINSSVPNNCNLFYSTNKDERLILYENNMLVSNRVGYVKAQKGIVAMNHETDYLFTKYFKILDSAAKATPNDTIYVCCIGPINFMELNTNLDSHAPGTFVGKMYFTKNNLIAWHKWYKEYRERRKNAY